MAEMRQTENGRIIEDDRYLTDISCVTSSLLQVA